MFWEVIQQSLPMFEQGLIATLWLSAVGIVGSLIVGVIVSLVQFFLLLVLRLPGDWFEDERRDLRDCRLDFSWRFVHGRGVHWWFCRG